MKFLNVGVAVLVCVFGVVLFTGCSGGGPGGSYSSVDPNAPTDVTFPEPLPTNPTPWSPKPPPCYDMDTGVEIPCPWD